MAFSSCRCPDPRQLLDFWLESFKEKSQSLLKGEMENHLSFFGLCIEHYVMRELKTDRLTLRPLQKGDAEPIARLAGDWDVATMTERIPYPLEGGAAMDWVQAVKNEVIFSMDLNGEFIGCAGMAPKDDGNTELGYWVGKPWWGKGYATEAGLSVVRYGFLELGVPCLISGHFEDNPASGRVLRKLGFEPTGEACERYCAARKENVICLGFRLERARAEQLKLY